MIDLGLLEYDPSLAETILSVFTADMVSPDRWVWLVGNRGRLAQLRRQYDMAEEHYQTMFRLAEEVGDKAAQAVALQRLGVLYYDLDDAIAEEYYRESLDLIQHLDDLVGLANIHNNLGLIYIKRGQLTQAQSAFTQAATLLETAQAAQWLRLSNHANLGYLYALQEQWEQADRQTQEALRIAKGNGSPCDVAKLTYNLGIHQAWQGNRDSAQERYAEALSISETYNCWQIEELVRIALGNHNDKVGNYDEAISHFQRVAEIREGLGDKAGLSGIIFDIGTFYWHSGDCEAALDYYEQGIALIEHLTDEAQLQLYLKNIYGLAEQSGNPRRLLQALKKVKNRLLAGSPSYMLATVYGTLGDIYLWLLHRERVALACMREQIRLLEQLGRDYELAGELVGFSGILGDLGHYGNALERSAKAIALAEELELLHEAGVAYYNRGNCFANLEMWEEAERDYHRSLTIAEDSEDSQLQESVRHNLGELYRRQGRPEEAVELLQASLIAARERNDIQDEARTLNNLGLAYSTLGQGEKALAHLHNAVELCREHNLKREEANTLISLGNFYLNRDLPEEAKRYYDGALCAARTIEDIDMEEGSVLSLAYAHRQLGSFDEIDSDFKAVAERASAQGHYGNLLQFLVFAGEVDFEEGEIRVSAEMFGQALIVAVWIGCERLEQLESYAEEYSYFSDLFQVVARICSSIEKALQNESVEQAQSLYDNLMSFLQDSELGDQIGPLMTGLVNPLGEYIVLQPEEEVWEYLASAWAKQDWET